MSLPDDLLDHAAELAIQAIGKPKIQDVNRRRAVSACYFALFHQINGDAARLIAPNVSEETNHRIQRWFDHAEMKRVCRRFLPKTLDQPLRDLLGEASSQDLQMVALHFVKLQDARHSADYDLSHSLSEDDTWELFEAASDAVKAWKRIAHTAEANIFILSLLLWKNWDRDRL